MTARTALVTGGATRVGRGIAEALAAAGYDLRIHFHSSAAAAEDGATEIATRFGVSVSTAQADLTDPAQIERLFAELAEHGTDLDLLVNSAAAFESGDFETIDAEAWDRSLDLNVRAAHLCTRAALPLLRGAARRHGSAAVVSLGDLSGVVPWRRFVQHGVAKAALLHWTRVAALELAPEIRVNAVVPGAILPPPGVSASSTEWRDQGRALPLGRCGDPAEVGAAVVYLAGAGFVTGEILTVDGGEHLRGHRR